MTSPKLSIITVNLNNAEGLRKTIDSLINQTFTNYEHLIIDGGSKDDSVNIIKEYANQYNGIPNSLYWVSEPDKGIYNAMNKGILKADGEYLQFLNSGDRLASKTVLEKTFCIKRNSRILYGDIYFYSKNTGPKLINFENIEIDSLFLFRYSLGHCATFIKREIIVGELYDEKLRIVSDWKFFFKKIVFENIEIEYLNQPIAYFEENGISNMPENRKLIEAERNSVLSEFLPPMIINDFMKIYSLESSHKYYFIKQFEQHPRLNKQIIKSLNMILKILKRFKKQYS